MAVQLRATVIPHAGLVGWLAGRHLDHEFRDQPPAATAETAARTERPNPRRSAKVAGIAATERRRALVAVDAPDRFDLAKVGRALGTTAVRIVALGDGAPAWAR